MIYAKEAPAHSKLEVAWELAEEARAHPLDALDGLFNEYDLVDRGVQFSDAPVPEGRWFIDWGMPRQGYGGYEVVKSGRFGHVGPTKLASALCPECRSPIFTVLLPNGNGHSKHRAQQLCLSCGHWEFLSLPL